MLFGVYNFGSKSTMGLIFLCQKFSKVDVDFRNGEQHSENTLGFADNCTFIGIVEHSLLPRENTCYPEPISYQKVSRFQILLRQNFSNWSYIKVIKKFDKTAAV